MRKVVFGINMTADGFCSHTDGIADEELHEYFTALLRNADILLSGRITYELMVPFWPDLVKNPSGEQAMDEFARVYDSLEKIVVSTTLKQVEDKHTRIVRGNIAEEVLALKKLPGRDIAIGSLSIASQLSQHDLIDEYHFVIHPIVAGKGPRMFSAAKLQDSLRLILVGSKTFQSGVVALHYTRHQVSTHL
jgi:dihydrofolate reductase